MDEQYSVLHYALFFVGLFYFFAFPASILANIFGYLPAVIDDPYPVLFAGWAIATSIVCAVANPKGGIFSSVLQLIETLFQSHTPSKQ